MEDVLTVWGRILKGYRPSLAIEITRECPLRCPGCYAYGDDHLGGTTTLRQLSDRKGRELVDGVLRLVDAERPVHVSIVGGEPLVRYRELDQLLPELAARRIHVQVVTSAVRPIPAGWRDIPRLTVVISIDGLQPEHDARRAPATYARILQHIAGRRVNVHCTVTAQQVRPGYLEEFMRFWSLQEEVAKILVSLYTPQVGEVSTERLTEADRTQVIADLMALRLKYAKLAVPQSLIEAFAAPPQSPSECVFARTTTSVSADLRTTISPCIFGGDPDCANCGCMASAGLAAVARHRLFGFVPVGALLDASLAIGGRMRRAAPSGGA